MGNIPLDGGLPPPEQAQYYVSPDGKGTGTKNDPMGLEAGLSKLKDGDTLILKDGIYTVASPFNFGHNHTKRTYITADTGARPVITSTDNKGPTIYFKDFQDINGIWFGGLRDDANVKTLIFGGHDLIFQNCIMFNYTDGANEGGGTRNVYKSNIFINCGLFPYSHGIYISNSLADHTSEIRENIFIGGQAYDIHLWHGPNNTKIINNLCADSTLVTVFQGTNHVVDGNIWWKPTAAPYYPVLINADGSNRIYSNNYHGPITTGATSGGKLSWFGGDFAADTTHMNNYYDDSTYLGYDLTAPTVRAGNETAYFGHSAAEIDGAVAALKISFADTLDNIHNDPTIARNIATLQDVIDRWKAYYGGTVTA